MFLAAALFPIPFLSSLPLPKNQSASTINQWSISGKWGAFERGQVQGF